jgi:hypothetical protein
MSSTAVSSITGNIGHLAGAAASIVEGIFAAIVSTLPP